MCAVTPGWIAVYLIIAGFFLVCAMETIYLNKGDKQ